MPTPGPLAYAFDTTGLSTANRITNEVHTLSANQYRDYLFIVPTFAPFYGNGVSLQFTNAQGQSRPLVEGSDYLLAFPFIGASRGIAKPVYGGISFIDTSLVGTITILQYQTIGGEWTLGIPKLTEIMANLVYNPRSTSWEQVVGTPTLFPVIGHEWNLTDMVGLQELVTKLGNIETAIITANSNLVNTHINNQDNPHHVDKADINLNNVENYAVATVQDVLTGSVNKYVSALTLKSVLAEFGIVGNNLISVELDGDGLLTTPNLTLKGTDYIKQMRPNWVVTAKGVTGLSANDLRYGYNVPTNDLVNRPLGTQAAFASISRASKFVVIQTGVVDAKTVENTAAFAANMRSLITTVLSENRIPILTGIPQATTGSAYTAQDVTRSIANNAVTLSLATEFNLVHARWDQVPFDNSMSPDGINRFQNPSNLLMDALITAIQTAATAAGYTGNNAVMTPAALQTAFNAHAANQANPHVVTKSQVGLGNVQNLPVVTSAEVIASTPVAKYLTMEMFLTYLANHGGQLGYPAAGILVSTYCDGTTKMGRYSNGSGGTYTAVIEANSLECGWTYPAAGTVLQVFCQGVNRMQRIANGVGGYTDSVLEANSTLCGYVPPMTNGTLISTFCQGTTKMGRYSDGAGGTYDAIITTNSVDCGYVAPVFNPTISMGALPTTAEVGYGTTIALSISGFLPNTSYSCKLIDINNNTRTPLMVLGTEYIAYFTTNASGNSSAEVPIINNGNFENRWYTIGLDVFTNSQAVVSTSVTPASVRFRVNTTASLTANKTTVATNEPVTYTVQLTDFNISKQYTVQFMAQRVSDNTTTQFYTTSVTTNEYGRATINYPSVGISASLAGAWRYWVVIDGKVSNNLAMNFIP